MSSRGSCAESAAMAVTSMEYMNAASKKPYSPVPLVSRAADVPEEKESQISAQAIDDMLLKERREAVAETERRLRDQYESEIEQLKQMIGKAVKEFQLERNEYFSRVEPEVVQLALSIAGKILHREAQVDPMLVAGLVRITLEHIEQTSGIVVRVPPANFNAWQQYFSSLSNLAVSVVPDDGLDRDDCAIETQLGTTSVGLDHQLKEIERGFFDLLAARPVCR